MAYVQETLYLIPGRKSQSSHLLSNQTWSFNVDEKRDAEQMRRLEGNKWPGDFSAAIGKVFSLEGSLSSLNLVGVFSSFLGSLVSFGEN
jgi:hypothetical protein